MQLKVGDVVVAKRDAAKGLVPKNTIGTVKHVGKQSWDEADEDWVTVDFGADLIDCKYPCDKTLPRKLRKI